MKTKTFILVSLLALSVKPVLAEGDAVEELNELLRGEISAVETYHQALKKVGNEPGAEQLKANLADHEKAVEQLKGAVTARGGVPVTTSGAWGVWAETVVGSAKVIGDKAALKALKEGEEHGAKEYKEALNEDDLTVAEKDMIMKTFVPAQVKHIENINMLMAAK